MKLSVENCLVIEKSFRFITYCIARSCIMMNVNWWLFWTSLTSTSPTMREKFSFSDFDVDSLLAVRPCFHHHHKISFLANKTDSPSSSFLAGVASYSTLAIISAPSRTKKDRKINGSIIISMFDFYYWMLLPVSGLILLRLHSQPINHGGIKGKLYLLTLNYDLIIITLFTHDVSRN